MAQSAYWDELEGRLGEWVVKALKRRPASEARLAGSLRVAARHSPSLRDELARAADVLIERSAFDRPLYGAAIRAVAEGKHDDLASLLDRALRSKEGGGLATLAASLLAPAKVKLQEPLARVAACSKPEVAFGAGLALSMRNQPKRSPKSAAAAKKAGWQAQRALIGSVARIKESSRIELCGELLAPLVMTPSLPSLPRVAGPAMKVLRDTERHLGRWLVFARAGHAAGDATALEEARERAASGSSSSRTAWSLLSWAIDDEKPPPALRPSAEVVARLSDRPTSEREMSFLFRLASVQADGARGMLEGLCREDIRASDGVRAAAALAQRYQDRRGVDALRRLAEGKKHRELQGVAVAALWDLGERKEAKDRAEELGSCRNLAGCVWGGLVMRNPRGPDMLEEMRYRRLERGWVQ